jgi:hypothetical protein
MAADGLMMRLRNGKHYPIRDPRLSSDFPFSTFHLSPAISQADPDSPAGFLRNSGFQ